MENMVGIIPLTYNQRKFQAKNTAFKLKQSLFPYTNSQGKQWNDTHRVPEKAPVREPGCRNRLWNSALEASKIMFHFIKEE